MSDVKKLICELIQIQILTHVSTQDVREPPHIPVTICLEREAVLPGNLAAFPVVISPLGAISPDPGPVPEDMSSDPGTLTVCWLKKRVHKVILLIISDGDQVNPGDGKGGWIRRGDFSHAIPVGLRPGGFLRDELVAFESVAVISPTIKALCI